MRTVSQVWGALNSAGARERRFVIKVETTPGAATGDVYIRSHADVSITTTGVVLSVKPKSAPKIRTQSLNPDEGRATIGSMQFDAIDVSNALTDNMRTALLTNSIGWRHKRAQYFSGFRGLAFADFQLEDTQLVDRVTFQNGVYTFRCRDIQREMRKQIFAPLVARLAQPLSATATTIEIYSNPGFAAVAHGTSYSDAPSASVLYVQIDDEIIRVPAAGIGSTQLTSCVRGVLGTRADAHSTDENASEARAPEVREVIYLELPVPKLVYALLTGNLINQVATLPAHWHLGIDGAAYTRQSDFENIGSDLYVKTDDTLGAIERYILTDAEDGKAFIEKEILRKYGLYMPIYADGAVGLRRGQPVLSGSAVVGEINDSHIVDDFDVAFAFDKVSNWFRIGWNEVDGEPTRYLELLDSDSVDTWGDTPRLDINARGLVGSRATDSRVRAIFEGLRDRYAGPPILCDVTVLGSQSLYEVGDVIRLRSSRARDFTNAATSSLDRAFEIQGITKDLGKGTVTYQLFGASQKAGALPPLESTAALDASFYGGGTNIATLGGVVDTGTELQLPNSLTLTGASTVAGAIYYALKDVRIPSGRTVTYTQNVQLRIKGVFQIDGTLTGAGQGIAGVADTFNTATIPDFVDGGPNPPVNLATQAGTPAYFGSTQAAGMLIERVREKDSDPNAYRVAIQSIPATITRGVVEAIPSLQLVVNNTGTSIAGVPSDLRGTSGGPGGLRHWKETRSPVTNVNRGGTGGAGGAGLLIVSRGLVFGASGKIDSSGAAGASGVRNGADERPAWSGGGAGGAPGAILILLDGSSSPSPALSTGNIVADYGATPEPGSPSNYLSEPWIEGGEVKFGSGQMLPADRVSYFRSAASGRKAGLAAARFFFLLPPVTPTADVTQAGIAALQSVSLAVTESFTGVDDPTLTYLVATITETSVTAAYSHCAIYCKRTTGTVEPDYIFRGVAKAGAPLSFLVPADGQTYSVKARPVLNNGYESADGVTGTKTVSAAAQRKITTFRQTSAPTATGVGDIWIDSTSVPEKTNRWNGSAWVEILRVNYVPADATTVSGATRLLYRTAEINTLSTTFVKLAAFQLSGTGGVYVTFDVWSQSTTTGVHEIEFRQGANVLSTGSYTASTIYNAWFAKTKTLTLANATDPIDVYLKYGGSNTGSQLFRVRNIALYVEGINGEAITI